MILDYSDFIYREASKGIENHNFREKNINLFYDKKGICPFCNVEIDNRIIENSDDHPDADWLFGTFHEWEYVSRCPQCGWWEYIYQNSSDAILDGIRLSELKITTSVLRKYEIDDKNISINVLSKYIKDNPDKIYNIHHRKMEELVQSVLKEHYDCEVKLVGKSHDGGKDLILIYNDNPTIIQVKRRTKPNMTKGVSKIRELLGTTILAEANSCMFVTTAEHFSPMAIEEAKKAEEIKVVDKFDLVDCQRFLDMLQLHTITDNEPWLKALQLKSHK